MVKRPPGKEGFWKVLQGSCVLNSNATAPANVIVEVNVALIIAKNVFLDIDLLTYHLKIRGGAKVVIKKGGKVN